MHKDAYEVSKKFGKDAFYLIYYLGTSTMPFFYRTKSNLESFFKKSKFFSHRSLDFLLNAIVSILPDQMPKKFDKLNKKFKHHLILKVITKFMVGVIVLFGLYVQFHGDYSPGGGFQAGVIIAAAFILYGIVMGLENVQRVMPIWFAQKAAEGCLRVAGGGGRRALRRMGRSGEAGGAP